MSSSFEKYCDILLDAFQHNARSQDISHKKQEILNQLFDHYDVNIESVLFVGFSPGLIETNVANIHVTEVSTAVRDFLDAEKINYTYVELDSITDKKYDVVVAMDEYLTFASNDDEQRRKVETLGRITNHFMITTLRDYKNQDFKDREFSQPIAVRGDQGRRIYFEHYDYDSADRNSFYATCYAIEDEGVTVVGSIARRSMFFKQLAKFSLDAGAESFLVHKNLMHKSIVKKNYEHIITIKF